jgi:hypothetical protein
MHSTHPASGSHRADPPARPAIPARTCEHCGEFLPHACAPGITITRQKWTGRRIITLTDRLAGNAGEAA